MPSLSDYTRLRDAVRLAGESATPDELRAFLKMNRDLRARDSRDVATYGGQLLRLHRWTLPQDELWTTMEQVGLAAIDAGAMRLAASIVSAVKTQFPDSRRAARLAAAFLEAAGEAGGAAAEVDKGLAAAPDAALLLKRRVATHAGAGRPAPALAALRGYVDTFQADADAWGELGRAYAEAGRPGPAAFCAEEAVLHAPTCAASHAAAGDAHYTAGAVGAAARHYETAVALSGGDSTRALYGVCLCAGAGGGSGGKKAAAADGAAATTPAAGGEEEDAATVVPGLAAALLLRRYREAAPGLVPFLQASLRALGVEPDE